MNEQAWRIQRDQQQHYSTGVCQQMPTGKRKGQMQVLLQGYPYRLHAYEPQGHQPNLQQRIALQSELDRKTFLLGEYFISWIALIFSRALPYLIFIHSLVLLICKGFAYFGFTIICYECHCLRSLTL